MKTTIASIVASAVVAALLISPLARNISAQNTTARPAYNSTSLKTTEPVESLGPRLEKLISDLMGKAAVPGLSVALVRDGRVAWHKGFGVMNAATGAPVTDQTIFSAASLSKPVVAYAVLKLADAGKIDLDAPLSKYLPKPYIEGDERLSRITARRALSHTTGFPNWRPQGKPLVIHFTPGDRFSYSGEGFVYLQKAVESIVGQPLDDFLRKTVFEPLGMQNSTFIWQERFASQWVSGHNLTGEPVAINKVSQANAAASLHTTALDYAKFMIAVMTGAGLKKETALEMLTPQIKLAGCINCTGGNAGALSDSLGWSLGWGLQITTDGESIWHWGDNGVHKAYVVAYPKQKAGIVIFANSLNGLSIHHEIIAQAIGGAHPAFGLLNYESYDSPGRTLLKAILEKGADPAIKEYRAAQSDRASQYRVNEAQMNRLGYQLLGMKRVKEAIEVFKLNVEAYP
ncbi:MAG TPA: serine hydrolase domain-containing protein, partial [Blastocatellia bacterium]|nr:serine hydrolase domain-containing protein [Blastocatellia bacterium]